jgi:dipeptidyl aminopeptidase/acylaminoacyl peptidase
VLSIAIAGGCGAGGGKDASVVWDDCPYWAPDGRAIAFTSGDPSRQSDVFVVDRDGRLPRRLTDTRASEAVLGWRSANVLVVRRGREIYGLDARSGERRRTILRLPPGAYADLAPTGNRIAIRVETRDRRYRRVYVLDFETGRRRRLPRTYASALVWSANGERLTYGKRDLVMQLVTLGGSTLGTVEQTVTAIPSPNGSRVAYDDVGKLFVWTERSRSTRALRTGAPTEDGPEPLNWSPDGRAIFYRNRGVYEVNLRTGRHRLVTTFRGFNFADCLAASPDGRRIAFDRVVPGGTTFGPPKDVSLVVMNRDGSAKRFVSTQ